MKKYERSLFPKRPVLKIFFYPFSFLRNRAEQTSFLHPVPILSHNFYWDSHICTSSMSFIDFYENMLRLWFFNWTHLIWKIWTMNEFKNLNMHLSLYQVYLCIFRERWQCIVLVEFSWNWYENNGVQVHG